MRIFKILRWLFFLCCFFVLRFWDPGISVTTLGTFRLVPLHWGYLLISGGLFLNNRTRTTDVPTDAAGRFILLGITNFCETKMISTLQTDLILEGQENCRRWSQIQVLTHPRNASLAERQPSELKSGVGRHFFGFLALSAKY